MGKISVQNIINGLHFSWTSLKLDASAKHAEDSCRLGSIPSKIRWNWKELTSENKKVHLVGRIVRGKDQGGQCWHAVIVVPSKLENFKAAVDSGHLDVSDYGHSIFSGWGEDPPRETEKLWEPMDLLLG